MWISRRPLRKFLKTKSWKIAHSNPRLKNSKARGRAAVLGHKLIKWQPKGPIQEAAKLGARIWCQLQGTNLTTSSNWVRLWKIKRKKFMIKQPKSMNLKRTSKIARLSLRLILARQKWLKEFKNRLFSRLFRTWRVLKSSLRDCRRRERGKNN